MEVQPAQPKKSSNTIWFILGGVILVCCCVVAFVILAVGFLGPSIGNVFSQVQSGVEAPSGGSVTETGSLAPQRAQDVVWQRIQGLEKAFGCDSPALSAISVTSEPGSTGEWMEAWEVDSCGSSISYTVTFTPQSDGTLNYGIER
jgi:hypothetical protein